MKNENIMGIILRPNWSCMPSCNFGLS